ncbi:MAG: hypothetical protein ABI797_00035 [Chloroflexota bacterium]
MGTDSAPEDVEAFAARKSIVVGHDGSIGAHIALTTALEIAC